MHRFSPYRPKEAYKSTVELSIYIHQDYRGRGIATQLMAHILEIAKMIRYCTMWYPLLRLAMKAAPSYSAIWLYLLWFNASSWIQTW